MDQLKSVFYIALRINQGVRIGKTFNSKRAVYCELTLPLKMAFPFSNGSHSLLKNFLAGTVFP